MRILGRTVFACDGVEFVWTLLTDKISFQSSRLGVSLRHFFTCCASRMHPTALRARTPLLPLARQFEIRIQFEYLLPLTKECESPPLVGGFQVPTDT